MRLAPHFGPLVLGLPFLVCHLALTATSAQAWETKLFRSAKAGAETPAPTAAPAAVPANQGATISRWMNAQSGNQPPTSGTAIATNPSPGAARQRSPVERSGRGPLFHGYELQLPSSLFGRNKTKTTVTPPAGNQDFAGPRLAGNPSVRAIPAQTAPRRNYAAPAAIQSKVNRDSISPTVADSNANAASFHEPTPAPAAARFNKESAPKTASPKSPAEQLVAQAHEWSSSAENESDFSRIIETCRRARASQPSGPVAGYANNLAAWALNRRGQLKAEAGRTKEALLDFDDAIRTDARCWRALHNRGVLLAQDSQFEKAFDDFNRTIETNPEFAKAYSNRGALFVVANDLAAASQDYARAIELDPNLAVAHRGRGRVCHLLGKLEDAVGHYDAAVQLAPDDAYAVACRADLLTDLGRYVDAAAGYDEAINLDPSAAQTFSGSAWLLATCPDSSVRNPELAIERARIAIELSDSGDALAFDTLAAAQASAGDFSAATKSVRQAMELASPEERDVYQDRLTMYQRAKPYRIAPVRPVTHASYEE